MIEIIMVSLLIGFAIGICIGAGWYGRTTYERLNAAIVDSKNGYRVQIKDASGKVLMIKSGRSFKTRWDAQKFKNRIVNSRIW